MPMLLLPRAALLRISYRVPARPIFSAPPDMQTIKNTIAENFTSAHALAPKDSQFSLTQVPDQTGKVAVITGGSEGIGYGCTRTLLQNNIAKLFIVSKSADIAEDAISGVREEMGTEMADRVVWLPCDLSDWTETAQVASKIASQTDRLDILICNAGRGIMTAERNAVGIDLHMATNHVGHVVFSSHLLPLVKKTASTGAIARIVVLASNLHQMAPNDTKFESVAEINRDAGPEGEYGRSKLAQLLYARYLADHLRTSDPNIRVNAVHPGIVSTRQSNEWIHEPYPLLGYGNSVLLRPFKKSALEGCVSAMYAATVADGSGQYICPPAIVEPGSEMSQDKALGEQLMKLTEAIIKSKTSAQDKGCPVKEY